MKHLLPCILVVWGVACCFGESAFRVTPYLQRPQTTSMTIVWFSVHGLPGEVQVSGPSGWQKTWASRPEKAQALAWLEGEQGPALPVPFRHVVTLDGLSAQTVYRYTVTQSGEVAHATFRTAPSGFAPVRLAVVADLETEPESTGKAVAWETPSGNKDRLYPVDQTTGLAANLAAIAAAEPDLLIIAGDLVEVGAEQRDWEEFWRHVGPLAARVPILPALGNHEYYAGPHGAYSGHALAVAKYLTYFLPPDNEAASPAHRGRYYRLDYGAATIVVLDTNNGTDGVDENDTNLYLTTTDAPDFNPGTPQAKWLEEQLAEARQQRRWRFVTLHHTPWSSGPHGRPPSPSSQAGDPLSGVPVRVLDPLFLQYEVTALFAGHDEMYERSVISSEAGITLQVYDLGIGGDGLRGPHPQAVNPHQAFLAHRDSPENAGPSQPSGGKHYGHLLVDVTANRVIMTPRYVLPDGSPHPYDDVVEINRGTP